MRKGHHLTRGFSPRVSHLEDRFNDLFTMLGFVEGLDYYRQHPVGRSFLDFYFPLYRLNIEIDGAGHTRRATQDALRDDFLRSRGIQVLRLPPRDLNINRLMWLLRYTLQIHPRREWRIAH